MNIDWLFKIIKSVGLTIYTELKYTAIMPCKLWGEDKCSNALEFSAKGGKSTN